MSDDAPDGEAIEREAYEWVRRFSSGAAEPADLAALQRWAAQSRAHREAFSRVDRAWRRLGAIAEDEAVRRRAAAPYSARIGRRAFLGGGLAASVASAAAMVARPPLGLWPSWYEFSADFRTAPGERRHVALAGEASIDLNTRTSVSLLSDADGASRIALIAGEAMITARPDAAPVRVVAGGGRIEADNARFNLRSDDGRTVCVTCLEGEIRVGRGVALAPLAAGRQLTYSASGMGPAVVVGADAVTAWRDGLVIFRATPVTDVVAEINRYRPGRIILTNAALGRRELNARFRIEDMDKVVGQIERVFGAHASTLPGGIVLLG